jgi:hypothetical protein
MVGGLRSGQTNSGSFVKGHTRGMTGKKHSQETKNIMSKKSIGRKPSNKMGGETSLNKRIYYSSKYIQWRSNIFQRDKWTCQTCNIKGVLLEAHHKKRYALILKENKIRSYEDAMNCKELWNIDNGVTLCKDCHNLTKRVGSFGDKTINI